MTGIFKKTVKNKGFHCPVIWFILFMVVFFLPAVSHSVAQDTLIIDYNHAIRIALNESFTIKSHEKLKQAGYHNYRYNKAMFRPRLDLTVGLPLWQEYVNVIERPDGLPVYNSYGSLKLEGDMSFQYTLPTGGYVALSSNLFRENLNTVLSGENETLYSELFQSRFWVSLNQPVFTKNQLKENLREAEFNYQQTTHFFTRTQMDIVYEVTRGFYNLYKASKEVDIAKEKLANSKESYRIAVLKSESGRIRGADVLFAEVSMARDRAELLRVKNRLSNVEDQFKQLIGLELTRPISIKTDLQYPTLMIDDEKALQEALQERLEIKEDELGIRLQQIEIDRAKREREVKGYLSAYYDLTGISTIEEGSFWDFAESSIENITDRPPNRGVSFTLAIPVFDWGRGKERLKQAKVLMEEKELKLEHTQQTIIREVREIIRTVRESHEQIGIHEKNLDVARRSYKISRLRFENGDISSQELAVERNQLAGVQLEYLDAYIAYQMAINDLKRKTMWDFEQNRSYLIERSADEEDVFEKQFYHE